MTGIKTLILSAGVFVLIIAGGVAWHIQTNQADEPMSDEPFVLVKGTGGSEASTPTVSDIAPTENAPIQDRNVVYDADPGPLAGQPAGPLPGLGTLSGDAPPQEIIPAPIGASETIQLRYTTLLEHDPTMQAHAPENIRFSSGQRFCFLMIPSRDLYLYLVHEGSNGEYSMLNPIPGLATSIELLPAGSTQRIPLQGWFRMDNQPGTERIHIVASPRKVDRMEQLLESAADANRPEQVRQTFEAMRQLESIGYERGKTVQGAFSELTIQGAQVESGVIVGTIEMRHQ